MDDVDAARGSGGPLQRSGRAHERLPLTPAMTRFLRGKLHRRLILCAGASAGNGLLFLVVAALVPDSHPGTVIAWGIVGFLLAAIVCAAFIARSLINIRRGTFVRDEGYITVRREVYRGYRTADIHAYSLIIDGKDFPTSEEVHDVLAGRSIEGIVDSLPDTKIAFEARMSDGTPFWRLRGYEPIPSP